MKKIETLFRKVLALAVIACVMVTTAKETKAVDMSDPNVVIALQQQAALQAQQEAAALQAQQQAAALQAQQQAAALQALQAQQQAAALQAQQQAAALQAQQPQANAAGDFSYRLSVCQTKYREGQDRTQNVKRAAANINGTILLPGQFFSANAAFKPRTVANGYGYGDAITGNTHTKVIGGGICQVSSTLNVAVMRAGIIPTKRQNHSSRISYLASGLDATISGNTYDYQFVNTLQYPIMILTDTTNGVLSISIYSSPLATGGLTFEPVVVGSNKDNTTYLCAYSNGVEVARNYAFRSHYRK